MTFQFRQGTCDNNVYYDVVERNEYRIPVLQPEDVVIDIGTHIGSFAYKAWLEGSRNIHSFEPDKENYERAVANLQTCDGIHLTNVGVYAQDATLHYSGYTDAGFEINTGGGHVFAPEGTAIEVIDIDSILSQFERVKILKLDCEGSEWPILYRSMYLRHVDMIVMEYHEMDVAPPLVDLDSYEMKEKRLVDFLRNVWGYEVTALRHGNSNLGMIFATR